MAPPEEKFEKTVNILAPLCSDKAVSTACCEFLHTLKVAIVNFSVGPHCSDSRLQSLERFASISGSLLENKLELLRCGCSTGFGLNTVKNKNKKKLAIYDLCNFN